MGTTKQLLLLAVRVTECPDHATELQLWMQGPQKGLNQCLVVHRFLFGLME